MKITKIIPILFINIAIFASQEKKIHINLFPWKAECFSDDIGNRKCKTPMALPGARRYSLPLKELSEPGTADLSSIDIELGDDILGKLKAYSVYPHSGKNIPPYIQFQFIQEQPTELLCMQTVKVSTPFSPPDLLCATEYRGDRIGITITFDPIQ